MAYFDYSVVLLHLFVSLRYSTASVRFDDDPYIVHASSPNVRIYGDSVKHAGVLDLAAGEHLHC